MSIIRYEPWRIVNSLQRDLDRIATVQGSDAVVAADWTPAVDINEHDDRFVLRADLPGVDPKSIEVSMHKGVLLVSGERPGGSADTDGQVRRSERLSGKFARRFTLPDVIDADAIEARSNFGVLEITLPKVAAIEPRRIDVAAA